MGQLIFRNRWFALIWVSGMLVSLATFFGEGGGHEKLDQAAAQLRENKQGLVAISQPRPIVAEPVEAEAAEPAPRDAQPGDVVIGPDGRQYKVVRREDVEGAQ